MKQVSILGCGWLGMPLAKKMIQNGFLVKGSTTSAHKIELLQSNDIKPYLITLSENEIVGDFELFLSESEFLLIDIPPKLRGHQTENFVAKIKNTISFIEKSNIKKVLFVSSTSVFADDNAVVSQYTVPNPETESGKQLLEVEQLLQSNPNFKTTIIRFGGLIGEDRNPARMLAGKTNVSNPNAAVNLIHQQDCINSIVRIVALNAFPKTYNAVAPFHPTRKEYYTQKSKKLNLPLPEFDYTKPSVGKTILSDYLMDDLGFIFTEGI